MVNAADLERTERGLVDLIYAAMLGESDWQAFLDSLNAEVPGGISTLFFHDEAAAGGAISLGSGLERCDMRAYAEHYAALNPWMRRVAATPLGTGIVGERILPREQFLRTEYYADFLRRGGIEAGIGVTLFRERSCTFLLSTLTARVDPDENEVVATLLTRLAPHLARAFRHYRCGGFGTALAQYGRSLLEAPDLAVLMIGEGARLRSASPAAERLLASGDLVRLGVTGELRLCDRDADALLRALLSRRHQGARQHELRLGGRRLTLIRAETGGVIEFFGGPSVALVIEDRPQALPDAGADALAGRYGLTPAERRVAGGILAGLTLAGIAARGGVSRETVRGQLKAVYAKTGVNSQAALVRLGLAGNAG
jgi:DNA-binding CsgD family transcriptional regulator